MAIYRFSAQMISRSAGRSAVAAAAYRAGAELTCDRTGQVHDYTRKGGVVSSEIIAPNGAPEWATDRARLWNEVEAAEKRKDAQLAREVELALPRELTPDQRLELVRSFVRSEFVSRGMVADIAIHEPKASDGGQQPHAHVMLTTRTLGPEGFQGKNRDWNDKGLLENWREAWANHANRALERAGQEQRIDHRSLEAQRQDALAMGDDRKAQDLDREPQPKLGPTAAAMERAGIQTDRGDTLRATLQRNADRKALWERIRVLSARTVEAVKDLAGLLKGADLSALKEANLKAALKRADLSKLQQPKREQQEKARAQGLKKGPGPGFGRGL